MEIETKLKWSQSIHGDLPCYNKVLSGGQVFNFQNLEQKTLFGLVEFVVLAGMIRASRTDSRKLISRSR